MRTLSGGIALMIVVAATACGGGGSEPAATPGATSTPRTSSTGFGVPECDDYIAKYEACINGKVPDSARAMIRQQLDATRASWTQAASTPEGKAALATGCRAATDGARTAMQAYGCTF